MHALELKAILHRANPAVIRQFTMPDDFSLKLLKQVMSVILGWNANTEWLIYPGDSTSLSNAKALNGKDKQLAVNTLNDIDEIRNALKAGRTLWMHPVSLKSLVFRVSFIEEKEQAQEYSVISRFRGYNIPFDIKDLDTFNRLQSWWIKKSYSYYGDSFYKYDQNEYYFMKVTAERNLKKLVFANDENEDNSVLNRLDYSGNMRIESVISSFKVQDIKDIAKNAGIRIPSGLNRNKLIDYVSAELGDQSIFEKHIKYMTLAQYDAFQKFCMNDQQSVGTEISYDVAYNLYDSGLADLYEYGYRSDRTFSVTLVTELLQNYERWLLDDNEKDFLKEAKIYSSILGCIRLYGFIRKSEWIQLSSSWVEGELSYLNMSADEAWDNFFAHTSKASTQLVGIYGTVYLYDKTYLDEKVMTQIVSGPAITVRYEPDFDQLARIEAQGLYFEGEYKKKLEDFILRNGTLYGSKAEKAYRAEGIGREVYRIMRCNSDINFIVKSFMNISYIHDQKSISEFKKLVDWLEPKVRQIGYGGYTEEEYMPAVRNSINKSGGQQAAAKKVYPNDPCPCGSGKKYKNCHGARKL